MQIVIIVKSSAVKTELVYCLWPFITTKYIGNVGITLWQCAGLNQHCYSM